MKAVCHSDRDSRVVGFAGRRVSKFNDFTGSFRGRGCERVARRVQQWRVWVKRWVRWRAWCSLPPLPSSTEPLPLCKRFPAHANQKTSLKHCSTTLHTIHPDRQHFTVQGLCKHSNMLYTRDDGAADFHDRCFFLGVCFVRPDAWLLS